MDTKKSIINAVTQEAILLGEIDQEGNRLYEYQQLKKATFPANSFAASSLL